jgi:hypothetical protein
MTVKKPTGLTIIKLMVLLLIAGVVGSLGLTVLIKHRCLTDQAGRACTEKSFVRDKSVAHALSRTDQGHQRNF